MSHRASCDIMYYAEQRNFIGHPISKRKTEKEGNTEPRKNIVPTLWTWAVNL